MSETVESYPRTIYEAMLDAECYATSHALHIRLWRRVRTLLRFVNALAGSAAFGGWVANQPEFAGVAGLVLAIATAIDQAIEPAEKIAAHRVAGQRYTDLRRDSMLAKMELDAFDARLEEIKAGDEAGIQSLLVRACNMVLMGAGRTECLIKETLFQRFVSFFS